MWREEMIDQDALIINHASWSDLDAATAFAIAELRQSVFVVEQACPYPDLDELDVLSTTTHWWIAGVTPYSAKATLRIMQETHRWRIGRVATAPSVRSHGYASKLMVAGMAWIADHHDVRTVALDAQSRLEPWYASFGFVVSGPRFLEDGIEHTPMLASTFS